MSGNKAKWERWKGIISIPSCSMSNKHVQQDDKTVLLCQQSGTTRIECNSKLLLVCYLKRTLNTRRMIKYLICCNNGKQIVPVHSRDSAVRWCSSTQQQAAFGLFVETLAACMLHSYWGRRRAEEQNDEHHESTTCWGIWDNVKRMKNTNASMIKNKMSLLRKSFAVNAFELTKYYCGMGLYCFLFFSIIALSWFALAALYVKRYRMCVRWNPSFVPKTFRLFRTTGNNKSISISRFKDSNVLQWHELCLSCNKNNTNNNKWKKDEEKFILIRIRVLSYPQASVD